MTTIKLSKKQAQALLWAINLTEASFDGWTEEEMGRETITDLARLEDIYNLLNAN